MTVNVWLYRLYLAIGRRLYCIDQEAIIAIRYGWRDEEPYPKVWMP